MKFSNSVLFVSVLDGKSKDLLTMKLNEDEWLEYQNVMEDVVKTSGLDKSVFFDVRGNHDNFGVPEVGGSLDFFSKYSINGQLGRTKNVNSVTLQASFATQLAFNNFSSLGKPKSKIFLIPAFFFKSLRTNFSPYTFGCEDTRML